jgi:pyroglutamyl-peptidase
MGQSRRPADRKAAPPLSVRTRNRAHPARREASILLAGFEPFHGERRNPSLEVARALDGEMIGTLRVSSLQLPVVYATAARRITRAIARIVPAAVLGLGQAAGRPAISLERVAINLADGPGRDNAGRRWTDKPVIAGGPDAYFARLPLRAILQALERRHIPASLSLSAGSFICNAVMYAALHQLRRRPTVPCGFIHLPYDTHQALRHPAQPSMPLELMIDAVRTAIAAIGRSANSSGQREI